MTSGAASPSDTAVATVLTDDYRQFVVQYLAECDGPVTLADLVGGIESEHTDASASETDTTHILAALYHHHLPCLADAGVLVFDAEQNTVTPTETTDRVAALVASISDE